MRPAATEDESLAGTIRSGLITILDQEFVAPFKVRWYVKPADLD
jgi:hypothetical protein